MQGEMLFSNSAVLANRKRLDVGILLLHSKPMRGF